MQISWNYPGLVVSQAPVAAFDGVVTALEKLKDVPMPLDTESHGIQNGSVMAALDGNTEEGITTPPTQQTAVSSDQMQLYEVAEPQGEEDAMLFASERGIATETPRQAGSNHIRATLTVAWAAVGTALLALACCLYCCVRCFGHAALRRNKRIPIIGDCSASDLGDLLQQPEDGEC